MRVRSQQCSGNSVSCCLAHSQSGKTKCQWDLARRSRRDGGECQPAVRSCPRAILNTTDAETKAGVKNAPAGGLSKSFKLSWLIMIPRTFWFADILDRSLQFLNGAVLSLNHGLQRADFCLELPKFLLVSAAMGVGSAEGHDDERYQDEGSTTEGCFLIRFHSS